VRTPDAAGGLGQHSSLGLCVTRAFAHAMGGAAYAERIAPPGAPPPSGLAIHLRVPVCVVAGTLPPRQAAHPELKRASPGDDTPKRLPVAPPPPPSPVATTTRPRKHILLVDDHELILKLVSKMLCAAGFTITTAVNGALALAAVQAASAAGTLPDAVLTDVQARKQRVRA
jgi:hypothetical protein